MPYSYKALIFDMWPSKQYIDRVEDVLDENGWRKKSLWQPVGFAAVFNPMRSMSSSDVLITGVGSFGKEPAPEDLSRRLLAKAVELEMPVAILSDNDRAKRFINSERDLLLPRNPFGEIKPVLNQWLEERARATAIISVA